MSSHEVSIKQRLADVQEAHERADALAEKWLDARIMGVVNPKLDNALTLAEHEIVRAERRLTNTAKRLNRKEQS